jgi:hypothetical protein
VSDAFWLHVEQRGPDECWPWIGSLTPRGYGRTSNPRAYGGQQLAHRAAWEVVHGQIPARMSVCHHCDNPPCVNPDHLFLGTHADNMRDLRDKGRRRGKHRGPNHVRTHLTERDVQIIRVLCRIGYTSKEVGQRYNMSESGIQNIRKGRSWSHVPDMDGIDGALGTQGDGEWKEEARP